MIFKTQIDPFTDTKKSSHSAQGMHVLGENALKWITVHVSPWTHISQERTKHTQMSNVCKTE